MVLIAGKKMFVNDSMSIYIYISKLSWHQEQDNFRQQYFVYSEINFFRLKKTNIRKRIKLNKTITWPLSIVFKFGDVVCLKFALCLAKFKM